MKEFALVRADILLITVIISHVIIHLYEKYILQQEQTQCNHEVLTKKLVNCLNLFLKQANQIFYIASFFKLVYAPVSKSGT